MTPSSLPSQGLLCRGVQSDPCEVHEDYDCTLNQTNIGNNNNKFYIIQLLEVSGGFACWNRWGRVGEVGQSKLGDIKPLEDAKKDFEKKFKDKTKNSWAEREHFVAQPGKYTLIKEDVVKVESLCAQVEGGPVRTVVQRVQPCSLDAPTQRLITNIFSKEMLMNLDVKKMSLGKLSKQQLLKGLDALGALEAALKGQEDRAGGRSLEDLSSDFYTLIPHNFGRSRPPPINSLELLRAKEDILLGEVGQSKLSYFPSLEDAKKDFEKKFKDKTKNSWAEREHFVAHPGKYTLIEVQGEMEAQEAVVKVLADIELAQTLQAAPEEGEEVEEVTHPLDRDYQLLRCQLQLLDPEAPEYKVIHTYMKQTSGSPRGPVLRHAWKVNRDGEEDRFQTHSTLGNRRLLWYSNTVAVTVAAILTRGLRIMPHSGGRVGKGIYFASENSKSASYVTTMKCEGHRIAYMFLAEVALGREHHITADDDNLKQAPPGFDSVIARGRTEPASALAPRR
ncbi:Poly [ADP-ribose] polymerase 3 [Myotis davidii]|uniref:Poly [ADP-ribose] polymerase n=1 Tax=Myotis davidii TaxID=225400 RepID=L5LGQ7_MYODS|nr:Poly [ADP-ribose] polymerase 3 [Myotis davidii]